MGTEHNRVLTLKMLSQTEIMHLFSGMKELLENVVHLNVPP